MLYYFAYGSNMNEKQMQERCNDRSIRHYKRAYLKGYRFVYDGYSSSRKRAVANVVPDENGIVWGVIYKITEDCLSRLDQYEGYPEAYTRDTFEVTDEEGNKYKAVVYYRTGREPGEPSEDYVRTVEKGALSAGLPEEYIRKHIRKE